jgi:pimeloyl-ACP methyl ester carboxylesterase
VRAVRRIGLLVVILGVVGWFALPWVVGAPDLSAPPPDRSVAIGNDLEVNVRELGAGSPVVLVHGLPSNIGDWAGVPDALAALGHRVIVYDRVGYGWSSRPPVAGDAYTLASNARELGAVLDQLDIARATLVAWSYGGGVVQTFAVEHPERVNRLVLLGSVGPARANRPRDFIGKLSRSALGPPVFRTAVAIAPLGRPVLDGALAEVFSGAENIPSGWADRSAAQMAQPGTVDSWLAEGRNDGYAALRPEAIEAPTLVLHGDDDRSVPLAVAEDLAQRLPNDELVIVEGGSHMLPATHPDRVAAEIHAWMVKP